MQSTPCYVNTMCGMCRHDARVSGRYLRADRRIISSSATTESAMAITERDV